MKVQTLNQGRKALMWIVLFQFALPAVSWGRADVEDGEEVDIRACGNFEVKADLTEDQLPLACRTDDKARDKRWKTKGAQTELHVPKSSLSKVKTPREMIDLVLLDMIRDKVKAKLKAFAWVKGMQKYVADDPSISKKIEAVTKEYAEFEKKILEDEGKGAQHEVRRLLTLYPDIEAEILAEHPDYKPLICKYELRKHRAQTLKTCGKILAITGTIVSLVGGPATAYFWIPALPKILMLGGGLNVVAGSLKIGSAVLKWDDVRAANTAKALLEFNQDQEKIIKKLKKEPPTEETKAMITYLQKNRLSDSEIQRLKKIKTLKRKEAALLLSGIMNTTFGAASIYGGILAQQKFADFKATEPAHVTEPYQPNTSYDPNTPPPGGGGDTGGSTTGGGWIGNDDGG